MAFYLVTMTHPDGEGWGQHVMPHVEYLRCLAGTKELPELKKRLGYAYEPRKFEVAGLTPVASQTVAAPRVLECPIQLEAVVAERHDIMADDPQVAV